MILDLYLANPASRDPLTEILSFTRIFTAALIPNLRICAVPI
jgi:hypothetical protein